MLCFEWEKLKQFYPDKVLYKQVQRIYHSGPISDLFHFYCIAQDAPTTNARQKSTVHKTRGKEKRLTADARIERH